MLTRDPGHFCLLQTRKQQQKADRFTITAAVVTADKLS